MKVVKNFRTYLKREKVLLILLLSLLILAFVVPTYVHFIPYGTDVYSHLFFTRQMVDANSLNDFYKRCLEEGYLRYDYPFGLWLFGSIVAKVTGMNMLELAQNVPFVIMLILLILYISYARIFGASERESVLSVAFLLSMPILCTDILEYSTRVFVGPFLIFILYLILADRVSLWKQYFLINLLIFILCFSHTGTYMFLLSLILVFIFMFSIVYGKIHRDAYITMAGIMLIYIIVMNIFPNVHSQYIDKGRILVSVGSFFASNFHIQLLSEVGNVFYEQIFVNLSLVYVMLWCFSIYAICKFLIFIRSKIEPKAIQRVKNLSWRFFSIPIIGGIRHVSHSILLAPFWLGPVHVTLAAIGAFKTNRKGLCILLSTAIVTLFSGYTVSKTGGNALRELEYLYIIVPILSALGFNYAKERVKVHIKGYLRKVAIGVLLLIVFSSIVVLPVIGNLYYHPLISGADYERVGLRWLSGIGKPDEGCAGFGYRHMITIYGHKIPPGVTKVASGSDMSRYEWDQYSACFQMNSEKYVDDLYATFGVNYLVVSERTIRNFGEKPYKLKVDYNKQLDKIYSSIGYFSIYKYITSPIHRTDIKPKLSFADKAIIEDAGDTYIVDTDYYKVRIGKTDPGMRYIGNKTTNLLGREGLYYDFLIITWSSGSHRGKIGGWAFHEMTFPNIILGENQIIYKTILKKGEEKWATLMVKYTFFKKAFKREIVISNDWVNDSTMDINELTMTFFSPLRHFDFQLDNEKITRRTMYPCQDEVPINKIRFNKLFIHNNNYGIYVKFENSCSYPNAITYYGLTNYPYYTLTLHMKQELRPSESMHVTQWISIGKKDEAETNIEHYTSVSLYPYPNGEIPLVLISDIGSLGRISDETFNESLKTYKMLKDAKFTEALSMKELNESRLKILLKYDIDIIGKEKLGANESERIRQMKERANELGIRIQGVMPEGYNLEAIKILAEENFSFMISKSVPPPFERYFQEGLRKPQMAYYHGEPTDLILLPISLPTIGGFTYFYGNDYESAWKAVIDSVIKNEDLCVFLWDSTKVSKPKYVAQVLNTTKYAKEKGMTFTTPHEIARHLMLLKNVFATVSKEDEKIVISVQNRNNETVSGVTFKIKTNYGCKVENGKIVRTSSSPEGKMYYVSVDLLPKETKTIVIGLRRG